MKLRRWLLILFLTAGGLSYGQTAPTFRYNSGKTSLTVPGRDPAQGGTTVIPTVLVPVRLVFDAAAGRSQQTLDAATNVSRVLHSPVFSKASFGPK
ncbi:MAG TPA: glycoside hydrolase, partial [Acidobacteriaceae bacterium]|nr:glycoside hydrolase [Acidobacteriaceae bacterium]